MSSCTVYVFPVLPPDTSLTPDELLDALSTMDESDFWNVISLFGVPLSVKNEICKGQSDSCEKRRRGLEYFLQTVPGVSWEMIAGVLWFKEEHMALKTVRRYLPHKQGDYTMVATCTYSKVQGLLVPSPYRIHSEMYTRNHK